MKQLNFVLELSLLVLCALLVAGCASQLTGHSIEKKSITIGAVLPLTGPLAYKGVHEQNGIDLALKEINQKGGIDGRLLAVVYEDHAFNPAKAAIAAQKFIEIDDVPIIFTAGASTAQAIAPLVQEHDKVLIYQSTVSSIAEKNSNIFKDYYSMSEAGKSFAKLAKKERLVRIGLLYSYSEWGLDFKKGFEEEADELGLNIVISESFDSAATDLKISVLKIKDASLDGFIFVGLEKDNLNAMQEMNNLNILNTRLFMLELLNENTNLNPIALEVMNKTHAITSWYSFDTDSSDAKIKPFVEAYQNEFGMIPRADAAYFYDDMHVIAKILKKCNEQNAMNSTCIIFELKNVRNFPGVGGNLTFSENRTANRPLAFYQYAGGGWQSYS